MAVDKFPVEAGHIMLFARSIGDKNPVYYGETGEVIAPPTFVQSSAQFDPDYFLRPKIGESWFGSGKSASGVSEDDRGGVSGGLHAEQHYEYHRQLKPGDILTATTKPGKEWEKEGRRAGKLKFRESITEYRDQDGELVITARSIGVQTERPATSA